MSQHQNYLAVNFEKTKFYPLSPVEGVKFGSAIDSKPSTRSVTQDRPEQRRGATSSGNNRVSSFKAHEGSLKRLFALVRMTENEQFFHKKQKRGQNMQLIQKAVMKEGEKFLILLRSSKTKYFPECWDFPGGKLEPGEDPFLGIQREVKEETGFDVQPLYVLGSYEFDLDHRGEKTHSFAIYDTELISRGKPILSDEHTDYRWAIKEEILSLNIEPYFKFFFEEHPEI